jgi:hypothetical protein
MGLDKEGDVVAILHCITSNASTLKCSSCACLDNVFVCVNAAASLLGLTRLSGSDACLQRASRWNCLHSSSARMSCAFSIVVCTC